MERYVRVFLLGIFMMFGFTTNASASSRMYTLPITSTAPYNITYYPDPTQRDMGNTPCADDPYYPYYGGSKPHEGMDFILPVGTPVYAAADGTVTHVVETCEDNICYGNYLYINHGNNNWTMYAHLDSYVTDSGQYVNQGDLIAYSGVSGTGTPHLHWEVVTGTSAVGGNPHNPYYCDDEWFTTSPPTYADQLIDCSTYASTFTSAKSAYGSLIGSKTGSPYLYGGLCAQNYDASGTSYGTSAILFDPSGEANQAYLVRSGFWNHYDNVCGGPDEWCATTTGNVRCGAPINDEYGNGTNTARQDFQGCYLYWDGTVARANAYPAAAPGEFDGGIYNSISYAFAEAYEANGARNDLGEAVEQFGNPAGVHRWGNDSSLSYVQDFDGGTYGWSVLMYNEDLEAAFMITGDIWDRYNNYGPEIYGPPCDDLQDVTGGAIQYFEDAIIKWKSSTGGVNISANSFGCIGYSILATSTTGLDWDNDIYSEADGDCDDTNPNVSPRMPEWCDGIDNNCDGATDEVCAISGSYSSPTLDWTTFWTTAGLSYYSYEPFQGYSSGTIIPSGWDFGEFVLAQYAGAWLQHSWGDYACVMADSGNYTSVSFTFPYLLTTVAPVTYNLEQNATACGYYEGLQVGDCYALYTDPTNLLFQGMQFPSPINQLVITSAVKDDNFCFDTIWLERDHDSDGLGETLDPDDSVSTWTAAEHQYLFIDSDGNGIHDPCVRRNNVILCDEDMDGSHDYAFSYGSSGATYFSNGTGVTVKFGGPTYYHDTDSNGATNHTSSYGDGISERQRLVWRNTMLVRWDRTLYLDRNLDGLTDEVQPFGWSLPTQIYYLAEMNGDGNVDLLIREGNRFYVDDNSSHDGNEDWSFTYGYSNGSDDYSFADLTGDGRDEVIIRRNGNHFLVLDNTAISRTCPNCSNANSWDFYYGHGL